MEAKHTSLVDSQYKIPFILVTSLFFLWGFAHAILDVLNKHFQEVLDISKAHSAFVQVTMYMGYFIMAIPAGLFISRYGYRKGVVFGLHRSVSVCTRTVLVIVQRILVRVVRYRLRTDVLRDRRQSLCHRTWCKGDRCQPIELGAVV